MRYDMQRQHVFPDVRQEASPCILTLEPPDLDLAAYHGSPIS